jgi:hypothetical protein
MSLATLTEREGIAIPHIGHAHHRRRNSWLMVGLLAAGAGWAGYYVYIGRQKATAAAELSKFRAVYSQRCDATAFSGPQAEMAKELFLGSSALRAALDRELTALESGGTCENVFKALRAVDFPISESTVPRVKAPTITLQPNLP